MVDDVKFAIIVGFAAAAQHILRPLENPTIHLIEFRRFDNVLFRIKIVEIGKLVPERITNHAVRLSHGLNALFAHDDVVAKIL